LKAAVTLIKLLKLMGCAESIDAQDPSSSQPLRRAVDIKPTASHLVTKPEGASPVENPSSGVKT